jgi:hypothetical protein
MQGVWGQPAPTKFPLRRPRERGGQTPAACLGQNNPAAQLCYARLGDRILVPKGRPTGRPYTFGQIGIWGCCAARLNVASVCSVKRLDGLLVAGVQC